MPRTRASVDTPTVPCTGCPRPSRVYPGDLARTAWARTGPSRPAGISDETVENMVLCAGEMFADACDRSRSGQATEGRVTRTLYMSAPATVRIGIVDDGMYADAVGFQGPEIP